ncbi:dicarboxylate/amino acid:cation symporter [Mycolicibacterium mageritense]|uniref:dicarboxylate/amino acid:cation symporter n=1 Tax=Mycolicibacterium mageritense TaxID=53462 RepID=UPI001E4572C4|nr:dicarboxylate/amino acid:cation symporter [Mycolicibacterium mageritense]GJJ23873.1 proton/glutamate symporter [Mycolicibacterium mageritense]
MGMIQRVKRTSLTTWVFVALFLGASAGAAFGDRIVPLGLVGDLWLKLIKLIIVPLMLAVMIRSITSQKSGTAFGRTVGLAFGFYVVTTAIAALIGSTLATFFAPGQGFDYQSSEPIKPPREFSLAGFFEDLVSDNMFNSFAEGKLLQIVAIAILLGFAIRRIPDSTVVEQIAKGLDILTQIVFAYVRMVIAISPIGVFFLMASTIGKYGSAILGSFSQLIGVFYLGVLLQILFVYGLAVWAVARVNPLSFLRRSTPLWMFTLSTASSAAAIPVNLRVAKDGFGVSDRVRNFMIPLATEFNHDGNAILLPSMVVFASQAAGIHLSFEHLIQIVLLGTVLSFGGGGVPGGGIVKVLAVLQTFGLPLEIGAIAAGLYRLFDMGVTSANCLGDLAGTIVIDRILRRRSTEPVDTRE